MAACRRRAARYWQAPALSQVPALPLFFTQAVPAGAKSAKQSPEPEQTGTTQLVGS